MKSCGRSRNIGLTSSPRALTVSWQESYISKMTYDPSNRSDWPWFVVRVSLGLCMQYSKFSCSGYYDLCMVAVDKDIYGYIHKHMISVFN